MLTQPLEYKTLKNEYHANNSDEDRGDSSVSFKSDSDCIIPPPTDWMYLLKTTTDIMDSRHWFSYFET